MDIIGWHYRFFPISMGYFIKHKPLISKGSHMFPNGLFTWSGPKNSRNIREKYAKNLRNIREKYAKNLRKICEKIAKKSQKIKIREKFVKKSWKISKFWFFAIFLRFFRKFFVNFSRIFREYFANFSRIFREYFANFLRQTTWRVR